MRPFFLLLPLLSVVPLAASDATWAQVKAIIDDRCIDCHGPKKQKGKLRLDTPEWLKKGGKEGAVLAPGKPDESKLYKLTLLPADDDDKMPPKGDRLTPEQTATIKSWIAAGATFDGAPGAAGDHPTPVKMPAPEPAVTDAPAIPADALSALAAQQIGATVLAGGWLDLNAAHTRNGITDDQLALLAKTGPAVAFLNLSGSGVSDRQLGQLKSFPHLQRLHLERTPIGDAGLRAIAACRELGYLNLVGTAVTDAGLPALAPLADLQTLYLWQTAVTPAGVDALRKKLPDLDIVVGPDDLPKDKLVPKGKRKKK